MSTHSRITAELVTGYLQGEGYSVLQPLDVDRRVGVTAAFLARKDGITTVVLVYETENVPDDRFPEFAVSDKGLPEDDERSYIVAAARDAVTCDVVTITYGVTNQVTGSVSPVIRHWASLYLFGAPA
jgi:hypothetical protein